MLNQCNFIGRLGSDVEVRYTQSGTQVSTFTIACGEKYKDRDGNMQEETEWVRIVAWAKLAEICGEFLHKGSLVFISGKQKTRKWQDQHGNDRYTTEIIAREMKMLSPRNGDNDQSQQNDFPEPPPSTGQDVPF